MNSVFIPLESCTMLLKARESKPVLEAARHKTSITEFAIESLIPLSIVVFVITDIIQLVETEKIKDSPRIRLEKNMLMLFLMSRNINSGGMMVKNKLSINMTI